MKRQIRICIARRVRQNDFGSVGFPLDWSTPVPSKLIKKAKDYVAMRCVNCSRVANLSNIGIV